MKLFQIFVADTQKAFTVQFILLRVISRIITCRTKPLVADKIYDYY